MLAIILEPLGLDNTLTHNISNKINYKLKGKNALKLFHYVIMFYEITLDY